MISELSILEPIKESTWDNKVINVPTGWRGCEKYLLPIIKKFNIEQNKVLEFGVDSGYSLFVLSQLFKKAIGVDSFTGDAHINHEQGDNFFIDVKNRLNYSNIELIRSDYRDFIKQNDETYDLIHIDIVHHYKETLECAQWSINHSKVVILHDIVSFHDVYRVCRDLSDNKNIFFNSSIQKYHGLGVLYRP